MSEFGGLRSSFTTLINVVLKVCDPVPAQFDSKALGESEKHCTEGLFKVEENSLSGLYLSRNRHDFLETMIVSCMI